MKTVVHLIPYASFPARTGGALRSGNVAFQLSRFFSTNLVLFQTRQSIRDSGVELPQSLKVLSPLDSRRGVDFFDLLPKGDGLRYRWLRRSWTGPSNQILGACHHTLRKLLKQHLIAAVILEHLEGLCVAPLIRRLSPDTRIILDAHNVDHLLFKQECESGMLGDMKSPTWREQRFRYLRKTESSLGEYIDAFWACSDLDKNILEKLNTGLRGFTIPNGVDCTAMPYREDALVKGSGPKILFCGSLGYAANRDGLFWFFNDCWPLIKTELPRARLCVVGKGGQPEDYRLLSDDPNVEFVGEVNSTLPYYQKADIAVCPLRIGSGTRLKVLEALSVGTPCVSTPLGCEGIGLVNGDHVLLASGAREFARQCVRLVNDKSLAKTISEQGRKLVEEKFDWSIIGGMMARSIDEVCGAPKHRC